MLLRIQQAPGTADGGASQNVIDTIIASRFACREFSDRPVSRRTIEEILGIARFAPSGGNIQPWRVYVLAGRARERVSVALLKAHRELRNEHVSEYKYYGAQLPAPYLSRREEWGRIYYASLAAERPASFRRCEGTPPAGLRPVYRGVRNGGSARRQSPSRRASRSSRHSRLDLLFSGDQKVRYQRLPPGLRAAWQRQDEADEAAQRADRHWDDKTEVPVDREDRDHRRDKPAKDSPLVLAEPARRCAHFGRKPLREIARALGKDAAIGRQHLRPDIG